MKTDESTVKSTKVLLKVHVVLARVEARKQIHVVLPRKLVAEKCTSTVKSTNHTVKVTANMKQR